MKLRVHELAKELQVSSKAVLTKLGELGEFAKSASSTIEKPVADKVRACFPVPPKRRASAHHIVDHHTTTTPEHEEAPPQARRVRHHSPPRPIKRTRREFYRGEDPPEFAKWLLDHYIVPSRHWGGNLPRSGYFEDEVAEAQNLTHEWAPTLLAGFSKENILTWITSNLPINPGHAVSLHRAGIVPRDIGWSYYDEGKPTLADRLALGALTLEQVVDEALYRRNRT